MRNTLTCLILVGSVLHGSSAFAESKFSVGSDPAAWLFGGYSAIAMVDPESIPALRITAEMWGMNMPDALTGLASANRNEGWSRRFTHAFALYVDYHPGGSADAWHVGGVFDMLGSRLTRDGFDETAKMYSAEFLVRGGYRWFPFPSAGLFVNPWLAAGVIFAVSPRPSVGGEQFVEFPLNAVGTLHIGYRFGG